MSSSAETMMNVVSILVQVIVNVIIIAPALWLSGRVLVGGQKAKFTDALWIVALGTVIGSIISVAFHGLLGVLVFVVMLLALVKHFFDCGWLKAIVISVIAGVIFFIIAAVLTALGIIALRSLIGF